MPEPLAGLRRLTIMVVDRVVRRRLLTGLTLAALGVCAGCSSGIHGTPVTFTSIRRSPDPQMLLIPVQEAPADYPGCETPYRATTSLRHGVLDVQLLDTTPSSSGDAGRSCTSLGHLYYVPVRLSEPYPADAVVDADGGHLVRIGKRVRDPAPYLARATLPAIASPPSTS